MATTHELRHANMMTPVLWYQSSRVSLALKVHCYEVLFRLTTEELVIELALEECLMV